MLGLEHKFATTKLYALHTVLFLSDKVFLTSLFIVFIKSLKMIKVYESFLLDLIIHCEPIKQVVQIK